MAILAHSRRQSEEARRPRVVAYRALGDNVVSLTEAWAIRDRACSTDRGRAHDTPRQAGLQLPRFGRQRAWLTSRGGGGFDDRGASVLSLAVGHTVI